MPILTLIVLLGGIRVRAQWAALVALGTALAVATAVYGMPVDQAVLSAAEGAAFGLFPIMWIVVAALWVYNMLVFDARYLVVRLPLSFKSGLTSVLHLVPEEPSRQRASLTRPA